MELTGIEKITDIPCGDKRDCDAKIVVTNNKNDEELDKWVILPCLFPRYPKHDTHKNGNINWKYKEVNDGCK